MSRLLGFNVISTSLCAVEHFFRTKDTYDLLKAGDCRKPLEPVSREIKVIAKEEDAPDSSPHQGSSQYPCSTHCLKAQGDGSLPLTFHLVLPGHGKNLKRFRIVGNRGRGCPAAGGWPPASYPSLHRISAALRLKIRFVASSLAAWSNCFRAPSWSPRCSSSNPSAFKAGSILIADGFAVPLRNEILEQLQRAACVRCVAAMTVKPLQTVQHILIVRSESLRHLEFGNRHLGLARVLIEFAEQDMGGGVVRSRASGFLQDRQALFGSIQGKERLAHGSVGFRPVR